MDSFVRMAVALLLYRLSWFVVIKIGGTYFSVITLGYQCLVDCKAKYVKCGRGKQRERRLKLPRYSTWVCVHPRSLVQ